MIQLTFNLLLNQAGLPLDQIRLLHHKEWQQGRTPYTLWRDNIEQFDFYQSFQRASRRSEFNHPHWASFVGMPDGRALFVGLYKAKIVGSPTSDMINPITQTPLIPDTTDLYVIKLEDTLSDYIGRLIIDWGNIRNMVNRPDRQDKLILELREHFSEPSFPGFTNFYTQLSEIEDMPSSWHAILTASRGIYLLSCPRTKEQYVGSASGAEGFLGRWRAYVADGHGGNVALKSREPSDYRVSILQTAGTADDENSILKMESLWKEKLQSREMGLNRN